MDDLLSPAECEFVNQLCEEIENDISKNDCVTAVESEEFSCKFCNKKLRTFSGLQNHQKACWSDIQLKHLDDTDFQDMWTQSVEAVKNKIQDGLTAHSYTTYPKELHIYFQNVNKSDICSSYMQMLHKIGSNDSLLNAILIEFLPIILKRLTLKRTTGMDGNDTNNIVIQIDDTDKSISHYIGGRVVRSLHYKFKNDFFRYFKQNEVVSSDHSNDSKEIRLWHLTALAKEIFFTAESMVKLALTKNELNSQLIAQSVYEKLKDKYDTYLSEKDPNMYQIDPINAFFQMVQKYVRIRGHTYAKRITERFNCKKAPAKSGKGKSLRQDLKRRYNE